MENIIKFKQTKYAFIVGILFIVGVYWLVLFLFTGSIEHPIYQIQRYWYWMVPMVLGFGIQTALFWYIRRGMGIYDMETNVSQGASVGTSTAAMILCCAHHLFDILPFLGASALGLVLSEYQEVFFLIGILANVLGIIYMYRIVQKSFRSNLSLQSHECKTI